jgi:Mlc titration factor MtfA (ptsG expression regulator)
MNVNFLIGLSLIVAVFVLLRWYLKKKRWNARKHLFESEFPGAWVSILKLRFPLYKKLPKNLQKQLQGHIQIFLAEKNFVGYNGVEITDTVRVVIAAQACLLLLNRRTNYYPYLTNILIYPSAFTHASQKDGNHKARAGESWHRGPIVLSWDHSSDGAKKDTDGSNVVMHEFAHQLDQENGASDGLPILQHNNIKDWSRILSKEFNTLKLKTKLRRRSLLDKYGATNPAEFFAVITEHFIEQPRQFRDSHPELYNELQKYYRMDPIQWN